MLKPKDLLHELEQGERIDEDLKRFLTQQTFTTSPMQDWMYTSSFTTSSMPYITTITYEE